MATATLSEHIMYVLLVAVYIMAYISHGICYSQGLKPKLIVKNRNPYSGPDRKIPKTYNLNASHTSTSQVLQNNLEIQGQSSYFKDNQPSSSNFANQKKSNNKHVQDHLDDKKSHIKTLQWSLKINSSYPNHDGINSELTLDDLAVILVNDLNNAVDVFLQDVLKSKSKETGHQRKTWVETVGYILNKGKIGELEGHYLFEYKYKYPVNYSKESNGAAKLSQSSTQHFKSSKKNIKIHYSNQPSSSVFHHYRKSKFPNGVIYTVNTSQIHSKTFVEKSQSNKESVIKGKFKSQSFIPMATKDKIPDSRTDGYQTSKQNYLLKRSPKKHEDNDQGYKTLSTELSGKGTSIEIENSAGAAHLQHMSRTSSDIVKQIVEFIHRRLDDHVLVEMYSQLVERPRQKRSINFNDPEYKNQWHLHNIKTPSMDINVTEVWERNVTGRGVTVVVVDDGLEWTNPDILENYSPDGSWDLNSDDSDPTPTAKTDTNHHGTRCAGEIAAVANNNYCAVGVAYEANIAGVRVLDGPMTDALEAKAFNAKFKTNDVYSCSWGPDDDGKTVDGPHYLARAAMQKGVEFGRHGYGSIFVVASGNGGHHGDNCNYDGYANSPYTVTIGAVDENGHMPYYAEECAAMLAVTFSSGTGKRSIVTTDWTKRDGTGCTDTHTGTSAAAPIAAGMIALMLQVRPCLTWRDVQYIIIMTAVKVDIDVAHWTRNAAGLHHSHKHGFGLMNSWRLVNAAKVWPLVPWATWFTSDKIIVNREIPKSPKILELQDIVTCKMLSGYGFFTLEQVQVVVSATHQVRGFIEIILVCPSGMHSVLAAPRQNDNSTSGFQEWTFSTVRCWGEEPYGKWLLQVTDTGKKSKLLGKLVSWQLVLNGSPLTPKDIQDRFNIIHNSYSGDYLSENSNTSQCESAPHVNLPETTIGEKTLKILVLIGALCLVTAVYDTFEYMCCYRKEKEEQKRLTYLNRRAHELARGITHNDRQQDSAETVGLLDAEEIPLNNINETAVSIHKYQDEEV